jgi:hypothetical protein
MGLLTKAAGKTVPEAPSTPAAENPGGSESFSLDDMGKALRDRIRRLPPQKTAPYVALSLMKAYGSFQVGLCLYLHKGIYTSYASVGLGIERITFPQDRIYDSKNQSKKYFKLGSGDSLGIKSFDPSLTVWAFPLDGESPWSAVLLLGAAESSSFTPVTISGIVEGVLDIINPQIDRIILREPKESSPDGSPASANASVEASLIQYHKMNPAFSGILVDVPETLTEAEKAEFSKKVARMTSYFGLVTALPSGRSLVLLPRNMDRDLIAHRLRASLKTKTPEVFYADGPGDALKILKPYF